jgi:endonuclease/exonuclease/phosphatase (EEP) superfamily protein YafD
LDGFFDVLVLLGLAGSWLGLLGEWHWALDLFSHFHWQYAGVCVLAIGWTLWRRRGWVLAVSLASLLLNGWLIGRLAVDAGGGREIAGKRLRVVSLNVLTANSNKEGVLKYLRGVDADVIFLMEVNAEWVSALEGLKVTHPHCLIQSRRDNFGVALYSRVPLREARFVQDRQAEVPSIEARLVHESRELVIYGTHPLPPVAVEGTRLRNAQLASIATHVGGLDVPALVVGDLNATPWSHGMRLIQAGGVLGFSGPANAVWKPTWRVGTVFGIPIDHALCTAPLVIVRREVGPDVGSDHRAIEVEVGWRR